MKMRKIIAMVMAGAMMISLLVVTASASNGNLTFTHGVKSASRITFASTSSTKTETSMSFGGTIVITAGESATGTYVVASTLKNSTNNHEFNVHVGKSKGTSVFYYYVAGTLRHTSTAPWNFDFR